MQRNGARLLAPLVAVAVVAVLGFGIGTAGASDADQSEQFDEGTVLHSAFSIGRGVGNDGRLEEILSESWLRVGSGGAEEDQRAVITDREGQLLQEGIRRRADGFGTTYLAETGEVIHMPRPLQLSAVMWTQDLVSRELLGEGYELLGESLAAGVPAFVYEKRAALSDELPGELLTAGGIRSADVTGIVRRAFVGSEPFGIDLGEEAGYVLSDGSEFIPYYRRITMWDVLDEAPSGAFEWSPAVAAEVSR